MATGTVFDFVNIRNCNFVKINGSGISCNCSAGAGECPSNDLKTFTVIRNQESNKNMVNNEDGISNEKYLDRTRDLGTLDGKILNVFKDLIMLAISDTVKAPLDFEDLLMIAVKASQLKPLEMKELHDNEDHTITDKLRPLKEKMLISLQNQLNWKTIDFDLLPS